MSEWSVLKKVLVFGGGGLFLLVVLAGIFGEDPNKSPAPAKATTQVEKPVPKPEKPKQPELTRGQKNALASAKDYLDSEGFSKAGLLKQLSSSYGDGYSKAEATFAVNHVGADWNAEAVEAAKDYLEQEPMSKSALIKQLSSSYGDGFTPAQARYAANKVY